MADTHKSLDDILQDMKDFKSRQDSLIELTNGMRQKVDDALKDVNLTPEQQAKVDAIFDEVEARKAEVQAAIDANTPAAQLPPDTGTPPPDTGAPTPTDPNAPQVNPLGARRPPPIP